jgi:nitrite reductase/ring-hydroxylating ferredoxin subunit
MARFDVTDAVQSLGSGESRAFDAGGQHIALCRGDSGVFAVADLCTHAYARLTDGFVLGDLIECPLHQAQYRLDTGELVEGPECPALRTYRLYEQDGHWYVET